MDAGGDVELVEIFTSKGAGRSFQTGELDTVELVSCGGVVTDDTGAVAECDPEVAVAIDRHSSWGGANVAGGKGGSEVGEETRVW